MRKLCKKAIHGTGGQARLAADETQYFTASIQPSGFDGDGHGGLGAGYLKSYKLFAECCEITENLREGDIIIFDNRSYKIKSLSPWIFSSKPVYLSGMLTLCEEGDI